jgi:PAS domain S-box-containing protein
MTDPPTDPQPHAALHSCGEPPLCELGRQMAGIVENAMDAIITLDARFRVVMFNRAAVRMFGVQAEEAIGGTIDRFIPPQHRAAHQVHTALFALEGLTSRRMGRTRDLTGLRANGEVFPIEASISRTGQGEGLLMTVMARDVTQLRQAEVAQLARAVAEAASHAKTGFLSRFSHELRTPLNAVLGFAHLISTDTADPPSPRHRAQLDLLLQAGGQLRTLIDELLDISRIETGRAALQVDDFDLREQLDEVLRCSQLHALQCQVTLQAAYNDTAPVRLRTDPARLRQVLLNLVSNAIQYNRPGGWVRVEAVCEAPFVRILVRDNGQGMSPQQQAGLFQPFNRLGREHGGVPGLGIGLVRARQLVGLMGGELTLQSRAGEGTEAQVTLPIVHAQPMADTPPGTAADPQGLVLYVEDNTINAILVEQLLARWPGVRLEVAADGRSGLERAHALQPDVVLLDMQLPDMEGLDVLQRLKSDEATCELVVVILSANANPVDMALARAAGAADYWTKPIDFDRFVAGMQRLLGAGRA